MNWSCIAVKKPSTSANKSALVIHLFDASMSTYLFIYYYYYYYLWAGVAQSVWRLLRLDGPGIESQ
jgi:hypothetical protein